MDIYVTFSFDVFNMQNTYLEEILSGNYFIFEDGTDDKLDFSNITSLQLSAIANSFSTTNLCSFTYP